MAKRTFDEDVGIVSELEGFGSLMPTMDGRRGDYARAKHLKKVGLYARLSQLHYLYADVKEEWDAEFGGPLEKKHALACLKRRGGAECHLPRALSPGLRHSPDRRDDEREGAHNLQYDDPRPGIRQPQEA